MGIQVVARMTQDKDWFYWNNLPNIIPEDVSRLTDGEKSELLGAWEKMSWTKSRQNKDRMLENIRNLPAIKTVVKEWVMDRLKEAGDHYVKGLWLSSIALCGAVSEFLSYRLLEEFICLLK